ncbi:hypothetical protein MCP1_520005 [Candidatus Terasakiella magnetica]|nr:hypothetical protein MCP1_520005 [Candidatus Terasakiella magnetica]
MMFFVDLIYAFWYHNAHYCFVSLSLAGSGLKTQPRHFFVSVPSMNDSIKRRGVADFRLGCHASAPDKMLQRTNIFVAPRAFVGAQYGSR